MDTGDAPQLLLVAADDHAPALAQGAPIGGANRHPTSPVSSASHLWNEGEHPDDLRAQRWAVFAPEGPAGDAMLAAVDKLVARRSAQQGVPARVYRLPPDLDLSRAIRWKKQVFWTSERLLTDLPRYHLLLGDLHQLSLETQTALASDGFVGRLAFDRPDDYAAYAAKLLAAEDAPAGPAPRAIFHTVHDGTAATTLGHRALMNPGLALARTALPGATLVASGGETPAPAPLLQLAGAAEPTVLFSLSHGEGAPRRGWHSPADQRARQGAMSFGREGRISAEDLARTPFLPAGAWFMFACFGAGTPRASKYRRWLDELAARGQFQGDPASVTNSLPVAGGDPFISALPKAALANPAGPLTFIGHVDLAWTYSFRDLDSGTATNRPGRFVQTLASLLRGHRVGVAFRELFRFFGQADAELAALEEVDDRDAVRRAHLWMLRQDLAGFIVLGDPAARLSVPGASPNPAPTPGPGPSPAPQDTRPAPDVGGFFPGMTVRPAGDAGRPAPQDRSSGGRASPERPAPQDSPASFTAPAQDAPAAPPRAAPGAVRPPSAAPATAPRPGTSPVPEDSHARPPRNAPPAAPDPAAFFPGVTVRLAAEPDPLAALGVERLERAIAQVLLDERALAAVAKQNRVDARALGELVDRYRRAGRAALGGS